MKLKRTKDKAGFEFIEVSHSQSFKQVINYQSADAQYGAVIRLPAKSNPAKLAKAVAALELFVETGLKRKAGQQRKALEKLAS